MNIFIVLIIILAVVVVFNILKIFSHFSQQKIGANIVITNKILSDANIREFLTDITSNDATTLSAIETAINNPESIPFEFDKKFQAFAHITHSLNVANRIKEID